MGGFNDFLNGDFHDWFLEYHDSLVLRFPDHHVKMIPTGPAISKVLTTAPFNKIPIDSLYEDVAPHGRASIYFLAALTAYMAMNHQKAPAGYRPPQFIQGYYMVDQVIIDNYQEAVDIIWEELKAFNFGNGESRVFIDDLSTGVAKGPAADFELYPNPVRDWIHIESNKELSILRIYDIRGQKAMVTNQNHVDLSDLSRGLYVFEIQFADGGKQRAKVLVK